MYNGLLILEKNPDHSPLWDFPPRIREQLGRDYHGIHEFFTFPLRDQDKESRDLYTEAQIGKEYERLDLSFLQDRSLIRRYIQKCHQLGIELSYLFIQSDYSLEQWEGALPKMTFAGYEVAEVPLDACAIFDLFIYEKYKKYHSGLNGDALFSEKQTAEAFLNEYKADLEAGEVGDGEADLYVLGLYRVSEEDLLEVL